MSAAAEAGTPGAAPAILITGAASGIGGATALLFARRGWHVLACDRQADGLRDLVRQSGSGVTPIVGDVTTRDGAAALVQAAADAAGGRLDCLFNCAGLLAMGPHPSIDPQRIDALMAVNMNGVVNCIDAALPVLRRTPGAHIVNMSSTSAEYGSPDLAVYSASKFFVRGLTEALNIEFEPLGVQVSDVVVAYVKTPMVQQAVVQARSLKRLGVNVTPEQVARTVWRAAHGRRTHWHVGTDAVVLTLLVRLLGPWARPLVRRATGY